MQKALRIPASRLSWLWALLPLLLAAALVTKQLDNMAFFGDEKDSLYAAGINNAGPRNLAEVWEFIAEKDPVVAQGWSKLLFIWGRIAGWSEPAIRSLSLFAGLLALAWVYRAGRDFFGPQAGLVAALVVASSAVLLAQMEHARAFPLVSLFTALILWSYWRVALHPRPPGPGAQAGLLLGSIGLLYSHYFGSLILPVLGLFHLLFVPKKRRWWRTVLLVGLATMVAALQLPGFLNGLAKSAADEKLQSGAMTAAEIAGRFLHFLSNYLISLPPPVSAALPILLLLALAVAAILHLRGDRRVDAGWLIAFVAAASLLLMIAANELVAVMKANRIRYLTPLWPLSALFVSRYKRALAVPLAIWLILAPVLVLTSPEYFRIRKSSSFHFVHRALLELVTEGDLVIMDQSLMDREILYLSPQYIGQLNLPYEPVFWRIDEPLPALAPQHAANSRLWLLFYLPENRARYPGLPGAPRYVFCERVLERWKVLLERWALSAEDCPVNPVRLEFDRNIDLGWLEITSSNDSMRLEATIHSADEAPLDIYSLAVHVIDLNSGVRVAQGDVGVGPGAIVPLRSEIDVSALPPGDYEVRVALYDWQTGVRLIARDLETGADGDMHTLHHFRLG